MNRLYIGYPSLFLVVDAGWLAVKLAHLDVREITIRLAGGDTPEVKRISPSGTVPVLEHDGNLIWDSLAITEYCAEITPGIWPQDRAARAQARAICAEMHSSFRELRIGMPMNIGGSFPGQGRTAGALAGIVRIEQLWAAAGAKSAGQFLFGDFGAADAFYAPVVTRFATYQPELTAASQAYCEAVLAHPLVAEWVAGALAEPEEWRLPHYEVFAPSAAQ